MFSFLDAFRILSLEVLDPEVSQPITGFSIDTRSLERGNVFIALRGEKADGHDFLCAAYQRGAWGALIERRSLKLCRERLIAAGLSTANLILCDDVLSSLQTLAKFWRQQSGCQVLALTGSVGKTSTKDFLAYILSRSFKVHSTQGNFNNHIGLPLTLLKLKAEHQYLVAELGANHQGEIRNLCGLLSPDGGLITMIAPVHLEGFGSLEGIYSGKLELFESLRPGSAAVIGDDDPVLAAKAVRLPLRLLKVGVRPGSDFHLSDVESRGGRVYFKVNGRAFCFVSSAPFLARNAALAIAMAEASGVSLTDIPQDWQDMQLPKGRFEEIRAGKNITLIYDGYNASPQSFQKALEAFHAYKTSGKKWIIFSDMLELGGDSRAYHEQLGLQIASSNADRVLAYGVESAAAVAVIRQTRPDLAVHWCESGEAVTEYVCGKIAEGDAVLLKASRGMKIDRICKSLTEHLGLAEPSKVSP